MIQESPSFIWNLLKMIGNVFKISASATAIHPTKIPAQKPYTYKSQCPTGRLISVNTDIIVPKIPPSTIIFSKRMVLSARLHFAIILGTTPMTMINAKAAAAASVPAVLMRFTIQTAVQTSFSTGKWRSMRRLSAMDVRASISRWYRISARTVTVTVRMMHRSFRISECSQALIRSHWIRHVQMPA